MSPNTQPAVALDAFFPAGDHPFWPEISAEVARLCRQALGQPRRRLVAKEGPDRSRLPAAEEQQDGHEAAGYPSLRELLALPSGQSEATYLSRCGLRGRRYDEDLYALIEARLHGFARLQASLLGRDPDALIDDARFMERRDELARDVCASYLEQETAEFLAEFPGEDAGKKPAQVRKND